MRKTLIITVVMTAMAMSASAAVSAKYSDWAKGPVQFIMTRAEQAKWQTVTNDADAQAFVDLFWARRDPTPGTVENYFHDEFDARVKYADEKFTDAKTKGSMSDRGKVLIIMGAPTRMQRSSSQPRKSVATFGGGTEDPSSTRNPGSDTPGVGSSDAMGSGMVSGSGVPSLPSENQQASGVQNSPSQVWVYDPHKSKTPLYAPVVEFGFVDQYSDNHWKLERTQHTDPAAAFEYANEKAITQPNLTVAPVITAAAPAGRVAPVAVPVTPAANVPLAAFRTESLKQAVDAANASNAVASKNLYLSYTESITPAGDYFVPVQLFVPKGGVTDGAAKYTFFGQVQDETGKTAAIFEEPAELTASKDDYFFDRTLTLAPGKYKATFGLAQDGKPVSITSTQMDLAGLQKDAVSVSPLIVSNNVYALKEAQRPTDPYAFGGIKVVPKSDLIFHKSDDLWYFFELRNPGVDATTNPNIRMKLDLSGKTTTGKSVVMGLAEQQAEVVALKGVPGHFAVASSIPLATIRPGDYTLKVKVTDTVKGTSYNLSQSFKVIGD